ncbi:hypothetical protein JHK82_036930 [Glycine max]|nr:hypothetical protein JHK86_037137 [Glycine max]KAG5113661.1 hypothetical protein JHK82_036930 [Glycine max]KAG5130940.1 hypothetical protein JHK84_037337 [Glycine max]
MISFTCPPFAPKTTAEYFCPNGAHGILLFLRWRTSSNEMQYYYFKNVLIIMKIKIYPSEM